MIQFTFDTQRPYGRVNSPDEPEKYGQLIHVKITEGRVGFYDETRLLLGWWERNHDFEEMLHLSDSSPQARWERELMVRYDNNDFSSSLPLHQWDEFSDLLELY